MTSDPFVPQRTPVRRVAEVAARLGTTLDGPTGPTGEVAGVTLDSRRVRPGNLYAALPGENVHGARFALQAEASGAGAVLTDPAGAALLTQLRDERREATGQQDAGPGIPVLVVPDPRRILGDLSSWLYGDPSHHMTVIGITGTNGKTTTAYLMEAALRAAGHVTGLVGTVEIRAAGATLPSSRTTPEAPDLQGLFAVMRERGVTAVVIEVSSHSLALHRVDGTNFAAAAFTNFSQDHLDFHGSLEDYFAAKAMLFDGRARHEVVVVDDPWGRRLVQSHTVTVSTPARQADPQGEREGDVDSPTWLVEDVEDAPTGVGFTLSGPGMTARPVRLKIPGAFNAANAALAVAVPAALGVDPHVAATGVASLAAIPGRVERVDAGQDFLAVVDYAHTPDAVRTLLAALRPVTQGRLLTVIGCGGDRDADKRPLMGAAASEGADVVIVTDDNPRSEEPARIRAAVLEGATDVPPDDRADVTEVGDRREAITTAVGMAGPGDTVVLAGKGHEQGQDVGGVVLPFDDRAELRSAIASAAEEEGR